MKSLYDEGTINALVQLKNDVQTLAGDAAMVDRGVVDEWTSAINTRLLPRLMPDFPLVAAICGGGSAGKSTLFNTLAGETVSPTGGRAGINRRMLIALGSAHRDVSGVAEAIFDPFQCSPRSLEQPDDLTTPGDPLLFYSDSLAPGLALVDTPDFDTGAKGDYQNRDMAERALSAADVLIYIFTNANYNNRDNTDFIARMLTSVGTRTCFLVYRVDPAFSDSEVNEHAGTVARHLYGNGAGEHVLGVYRALEDNRVAAGQMPATLIPVSEHGTGLLDALKRMDPRQVRGELHQSIFGAVIEQAEGFLKATGDACRHQDLYLKALQTVQQSCVQDAVGHLPMDAVVRRFAELWQATDPKHIKFMRKTGKVVGSPVQLMMRLANWVDGKKQKGKMPAAGDLAAAMETDFVRSAGRLRKAAVDPALTIRLPVSDPVMVDLKELARQLDGRTGVSEKTADAGATELCIPLPAGFARAQQTLKESDWQALVDDMLGKKDVVLSLTKDLENELKRLVADQRSRMTATDQIRQTFSAMLNVIPATAAVTYVLHTGDPVGATGISVKLSGIFGLNDLFALVAIPATEGMKKADLKQLQGLLGPVARAWLVHKLKAIEALFETDITGPMLTAGKATMDSAEERMASMQNQLSHLKRVLEERS